MPGSPGILTITGSTTLAIASLWVRLLESVGARAGSSCETQDRERFPVPRHEEGFGQPQ